MCSMSTTVRLDVQKTAEVHGEYGILSNYSGAYMCIYAVGPCFTKHAKLSLVLLHVLDGNLRLNTNLPHGCSIDFTDTILVFVRKRPQ